jgi:membrane associated rhomboid family serine protease
MVLAAVLVLTYVGFQGGGLALGPQRGIEFRCNAAEYGVIPYEVTHPGSRLTDPWCQPQPESLLHSGEEAAEEAGHAHPRTDPGLVADAPTPLTVLTSMFMHGGLLPLAGSVGFLLIFGPRLERRIRAAGLLAVFLLGGLLTTAALVAVAPNLPIATIGSAGAVTAVIGAHLALVRGTRLTPLDLPAPALLAAWALLQVAAANLDAAQPVAGDGGDIVYLVPVIALIIGLLLAVRAHPRLTPEPAHAQHWPH